MKPALVAVAGGVARIGSTLDEIEACVEVWGPRLVDPSYTVPMFRSWIMKEHPLHERRIAPFWMGKHPVTNAQYRTFAAQARVALPESLARGEPDGCPVWGVTRADAEAYARWLGERTGARYRLPTEHEWEHAARGPSRREYPFGDRFDRTLCNTREAGIGHTTPVDAYPASELGLHDLGGNVEEWTASLYEPYPGGAAVEDDLTRAFGGPYPILRGGSFARGGDLARCARRHGPYPAPEFRYIGFRLATSEDP